MTVIEALEGAIGKDRVALLIRHGLLVQTLELLAPPVEPLEALGRLLALEDPEVALKIKDALEPSWALDVAGSFGRAARNVLGLEPG